MCVLCFDTPVSVRLSESQSSPLPWQISERQPAAATAVWGPGSGCMRAKLWALRGPPSPSSSRWPAPSRLPAKRSAAVSCVEGWGGAGRPSGPAWLPLRHAGVAPRASTAAWPTFPELLGSVLPPSACARHGDPLAGPLGLLSLRQAEPTIAAYAAPPSEHARHGDVFEASLALASSACPEHTTLAATHELGGAPPAAPAPRAPSSAA